MTIQTAFKWVILVIFSLQLQGCGGGSSGPDLAEITISITGLPDDVLGDVTFSIDNGGVISSWEISKTTTITGLTAGTYSLRSVSIERGLTQYLVNGNSNSSSVQVIVSLGDSLQRTVEYTTNQLVPGTINFTLDSLNLPAAATTSTIAVEGPQGFYQVLTEDTLLENLVPGDYQFFAADFSIQNELYGVYFDYGFHRLREGLSLVESAIIRSVPIRVKSVTRLERSALGLRDDLGNRYTIEGIFGSTTKSFLKKWSPQNTEVWSTEIDSPKYSRNWSWELALDADGNIFLGGRMGISNLFGGGGQQANPQAELHKYNDLGELQWMQNLPGLFFNDDARIDEIGIQDNRIIVFAYRNNGVSNPRVLLINIMDFETGEFIDSRVDESLSENNGIAQLITVKDQGHWLRINGQLVHYSSEGAELERFPFADGRIEVDPTGGFFTAATIDGINDRDVRFTRYFSDWTIDWRKVIENPGDEFASDFSYDPISQKLLFSFSTKDYFPGYSKAVNNQWSDVLTEWTNTGEQIWLRQLPKMPGPIMSVKRIPNTDSWMLDANTTRGYSQYGLGNFIEVGP